MRRLPSRLLPGTPLLGFAEMFDDARGSSETPWPYPVVVPSAVGPALLPFRCPHCAAVCAALVDPVTRGHYYDRLRRFSWCPACRGRFFVDRKGLPLAEALPAGATHAPSRVERAEEVASAGGFLEGVEVGGLDLLGCC